jgi:hypothetical protein
MICPFVLLTLSLLVIGSYNILNASHILGDSEPVKMFERAANLVNNQIINYRSDPTEKWLVLVGIAPGSPEVYGSILICSFWPHVVNVANVLCSLLLLCIFHSWVWLG